jgi:hypothetical protein
MPSMSLIFPRTKPVIKSKFLAEKIKNLFLCFQLRKYAICAKFSQLGNRLRQEEKVPFLGFIISFYNRVTVQFAVSGFEIKYLNYKPTVQKSLTMLTL